MESNQLKQHLVEFSKNWEKYVTACMTIADGKRIFNVTKNHAVYKLITGTIPSELKDLVHRGRYKVDASVGQGQLAGIPWLAVMDRQLTESVRKGFYICYLFSKNAKKLHLSIALGADQFISQYGDTKGTTHKISKAQELFKKNVNKYAPSNGVEEMDLLDEADSNFVRTDFSSSMKKRAANYAAGSFFTKTYDLENPDFEEEDFRNDLKTYVDSYKQMVDDPVTIACFENLDEAVFLESDKNKVDNLDYKVPEFNPSVIKNPNKQQNKGTPGKSPPRKPSPPSKKVGDAGEQHVYDFEKNRLSKLGRKDLADRIVKQYEILSSFPGYDIQSFDCLGNEIYIEVKSTKNKSKTYFEMSENEISAAREKGDSYWVFQVINALIDPKISNRIKNPMSYESEGKIIVEPLVYRITFKQAST